MGAQDHGGSDMSGIKTLDDIKARCIEVGDCWEWQGAMAGDGQPRHRMNGKDCKAHQTAFQFAGKKKPHGMYLVRCCGNLSCVNPAHIVPMTRSEQMKLAASMGKCSRPDQTAARTRGNRAISKYSMSLAEQIRQMRNDGRKCVDISADLGVPVDVVSKMSRGQMWAPLQSAASVFSWRPS